MPQGLEGLLAAQNMLPVLNRDELRGVAGDVDVFGEPNQIALIADHDFETTTSSLARVVDRSCVSVA